MAGVLRWTLHRLRHPSLSDAAEPSSTGNLSLHTSLTTTSEAQNLLTIGEVLGAFLRAEISSCNPHLRLERTNAEISKVYLKLPVDAFLDGRIFGAIVATIECDLEGKQASDLRFGKEFFADPTNSLSPRVVGNVGDKSGTNGAHAISPAQRFQVIQGTCRDLRQRVALFDSVGTALERWSQCAASAVEPHILPDTSAAGRRQEFASSNTRSSNHTLALELEDALEHALAILIETVSKAASQMVGCSGDVRVDDDESIMMEHGMPVSEDEGKGASRGQPDGTSRLRVLILRCIDDLQVYLCDVELALEEMSWLGENASIFPVALEVVEVGRVLRAFADRWSIHYTSRRSESVIREPAVIDDSNSLTASKLLLLQTQLARLFFEVRAILTHVKRRLQTTLVDDLVDLARTFRDVRAVISSDVSSKKIAALTTPPSSNAASLHTEQDALGRDASGTLIREELSDSGSSPLVYGDLGKSMEEKVVPPVQTEEMVVSPLNCSESVVTNQPLADSPRSTLRLQKQRRLTAIKLESFFHQMTTLDLPCVLEELMNNQVPTEGLDEVNGLPDLSFDRDDLRLSGSTVEGTQHLLAEQLHQKKLPLAHPGNDQPLDAQTRAQEAADEEMMKGLLGCLDSVTDEEDSPYDSDEASLSETFDIAELRVTDVHDPSAYDSKRHIGRPVVDSEEFLVLQRSVSNFGRVVTKRGYFLKMRGRRGQRRFFELDSRLLSYYKSDVKNSALCGSIALETIESVSLDEADSNLTITVPTRVYTLRPAGSLSKSAWLPEANEWVQAIRKYALVAKDRANRQSSDKEPDGSLVLTVLVPDIQETKSIKFVDGVTVRDALVIVYEKFRRSLAGNVELMSVSSMSSTLANNRDTVDTAEFCSQYQIFNPTDGCYIAQHDNLDMHFKTRTILEIRKHERQTIDVSGHIEGWLWRREGSNAVSRLKSYKKRFYTLRGRRLLYAPDDKTLPSGYLDLAGTIGVELSERTCSFTLATRDCTYSLRAASEDDLQMWLAGLGALGDSSGPQWIRQFERNEMEGYLSKLSGSRSNVWQRRWVVIADGFVSYFKPCSGGEREARGFIPLYGQSVTIVPRARVRTHTLGLAICTPSREFLFHAENDAVTTDWLEALRAHKTATERRVRASLGVVAIDTWQELEHATTQFRRDFFSEDAETPLRARTETVIIHDD